MIRRSGPPRLGVKDSFAYRPLAVTKASGMSYVKICGVDRMTEALAEPAIRAPQPKRALLRALPNAVWRGLAMINFVALLLAAVALRGWQLDTTPGLNGDEAWLGVQAAHLAASEPIVWRTP